jgi:hypothetical protein
MWNFTRWRDWWWTSAFYSARCVVRHSIRPNPVGLIALLGILLALLTSGPAVAAAHHKPAGAKNSIAANRPANNRYFVDFRSRPGYLFGHTYIVYGRLDERGRPMQTHYAGMYPLDGQRGLIIGSVIPVPASVRGVKDDYEERPTNIYRIRLTQAQYIRLTRLVDRIRARDRQWNLLFANCNDFAIKIAEGLGMRTPPSWLLPEIFVTELRDMNTR